AGCAPPYYTAFIEGSRRCTTLYAALDLVLLFTPYSALRPRCHSPDPSQHSAPLSTISSVLFDPYRVGSQDTRHRLQRCDPYGVSPPPSKPPALNESADAQRYTRSWTSYQSSPVIQLSDLVSTLPKPYNKRFNPLDDTPSAVQRP